MIISKIPFKVLLKSGLIAKKKQTNKFYNFHEARLKCKSGGYANSKISELVSIKTISEVNRKNSNLEFPGPAELKIWYAIRDFMSPVRVLDFGGGAGIHFFRLQANKNKFTNWTILETETMVGQCKKLENKVLRFEDNLTKCINNKFDIIIANNSLQYCENPMDTINKLQTINASKILILSIPLIVNEEQSFVAIQESLLSKNGPGTPPKGFIEEKIQYPINYISKQEFLDTFKKKYKITNLMEYSLMPFERNDSSIKVFDILFEIK